MKKNQEETRNAFTNACQKKLYVVNICLNWLHNEGQQQLMAIHASSGCMRSTRLAVLQPVTHEVTHHSAIQVVVMPAAFDGVRHKGYDRPRWQLFVYSWLGREDTQRMIAHLRNHLDIADMHFFLVRAKDCILL
ncbi:MAG: hypothetical protein K5896_02605 [Prevotella sp.]|jgi:hypothetical protein|nr:hypothetical protein [Prevotella sp.]